MPDDIFEYLRLAQIYDAFEDHDADLDVYVGIVDELRAHRVLDVGCSTRTFAPALHDDHMHIVVVPMLLGRGVRPWDRLKDHQVGATASHPAESPMSPSRVLASD